MIITNCTEKKSILKEAHHSNLRSAAHQPGLTLEEEEEGETWSAVLLFTIASWVSNENPLSIKEPCP